MEKANLVKGVWKYLSNEFKVKTESFQKKSSGMQTGIDALSRQRQELLDSYNSLNQKIKEANKNVTSVQPSVDEINRILKSYGFLNFEIVPSRSEKNQYHIRREDGCIAEVSVFRTEEEKHLYLFLTVAAASSLLTNVTGEYRDKIERPNLFCAGIARPASGKGLITYVQAQFEKIHQHFLQLSE